MLRFIEEEKSTMFFAFEFQYISCYGLSHVLSPFLFYALQFQYISCYGLSTWEWPDGIPDKISIHLMLRFITGRGRNFRASVCHFNTSHVTVYLSVSDGLSGFAGISIHLMLRFILL